jgi:hypothetical protein
MRKEKGKTRIVSVRIFQVLYDTVSLMLMPSKIRQDKEMLIFKLHIVLLQCSLNVLYVVSHF